MFHVGHSALEIAGHVLVGSVFIVQGLGTVLSRERFQMHSKKLADKGFPFSDFMLACGLGIMLAGGLMVIFDIYSQIGAWMLIVFTVFVTLLYQSFWTFKGPERRREKRGTFFNNLAILGGLFLLVG
jgi:putative oxidoreductase